MSKSIKNAAADELLAALQDDNDDLIPVQKDEFLPGLPLPTDVFVQIPSGKFIMLAKRGQNSSLQDLHVSQNSEVSQFFIRRDEYFSAVDQNMKIAGILVRRKDISLPRRSGFLRTASHSVFKEIEHLGLVPRAMEHSRAAASAITTLVQSRDDYFVLVKALNELPGQILKDALAGAALSVSIAKEMGWINVTNIQKLALAAFLRDVGMKDLQPELIEKPRQSLSPTERALWESHPQRGLEILRGLNDVPVEVKAVCLEHHENAIGQGFPRRLRDLKMHPFAKVVALADTFADLVLHKDRELPAMDKRQAMEHIEYTMGSPFNKSCLIALKRALDIRPSAEEEAEAAKTEGPPTEPTDSSDSGGERAS